jgi:hypothetical protein
MKLAPQPVRRNLRAKPALPNVSTCAQCASSDSAIGTFRTLFRNRRAVSVSLSEFFRYRSRDVKRHASKPRPAAPRPLRSSRSPSYASRGASIPFGLSRLRILPVTTGVWVPPAFWPLATHHSPLPLCFHPLADFLSLFAIFFRLPFFIFNSLHSFPKHPGVGGYLLGAQTRRCALSTRVYLRDGQTDLQTGGYDQGREM